MKKVSFLFVTILTLFIFGAAAQAEEALRFADMVENLNQAKQTSLYVKTYWQKVRGQQVTWTGEVRDVRGGRGKAEVYVKNSEGMTYKGYNIILISFDMEAAAKLRIGDRITFSGILHDYKGRKGRPLIITLMEATFQ